MHNNLKELDEFSDSSVYSKNLNRFHADLLTGYDFSEILAVRGLSIQKNPIHRRYA